MQAYKVVFVELLPGRFELALEVRVDLTGGAFYLDLLQAAQDADAVTDRHSADNCAVETILFAEGRQRERCTLSPDPDTVSTHSAAGAAVLRHGMMLQDMVCQKHDLGVCLRFLASGGKQRSDDLAQMVMGWDHCNA